MDRCYFCLSDQGELRRPCNNQLCTARTHNSCLALQSSISKQCGSCRTNIITTSVLNWNKLFVNMGQFLLTAGCYIITIFNILFSIKVNNHLIGTAVIFNRCYHFDGKIVSDVIFVIMLNNLDHIILLYNNNLLQIVSLVAMIILLPLSRCKTHLSCWFNFCYICAFIALSQYYDYDMTRIFITIIIMRVMYRQNRNDNNFWLGLCYMITFFNLSILYFPPIYSILMPSIFFHLSRLFFNGFNFCYDYEYGIKIN